MDLEGFLDVEERFWKGDASYYRGRLTEDALMVFGGPVGTLTRERTVETIAAAPRWIEVRMSEPRLIRLSEDAVLLTYRAAARREGDDEPYHAHASSVYVRRNGDWRLAFHQQTA